jgi:hypothetical protein
LRSAKQNGRRVFASMPAQAIGAVADCDLEYGQAFLMYSKGNAERICYGDSRLPLIAAVAVISVKPPTG